MEIREAAPEINSKFKQLLQKHADIVVDGLSGGLAGLISTGILHPFENIRTRLQNYESREDDE